MLTGCFGDYNTGLTIPYQLCCNARIYSLPVWRALVLFFGHVDGEGRDAAFTSMVAAHQTGPVKA